MLLDGDFFLSRVMHIGEFREMRNSEGEETGGVYGLFQTMKTALNRFPGTRKVIVVWDTGRSVRRLALWPEYKANRKSDDPEYLRYKTEFERQKQVCQSILPAFGCRVALLPCAEGDDILGWYARKCPEEKVVVTEDKDLLQLVDVTTAVYQPIKDNFVTLGNFRKVAGSVKPLFIVRKAIEGDSSDNIPGVPKMGKTCTDRLMKVMHDLLAQGRCATGRELLVESCKVQKKVDTRNRARYESVILHLDDVTRNMKLMDVRKEALTEAEEKSLRAVLDSGSAVFREMEALGFFERMEFKSFIEAWGHFSSPFRRLS